VNGHATVNKFIYLGSALTGNAQLGDEISNSIASASASFGLLKAKAWELKGITLKTKLKLYKATVIRSVLHARKTSYVRQLFGVFFP